MHRCCTTISMVQRGPLADTGLVREQAAHQRSVANQGRCPHYFTEVDVPDIHAGHTPCSCVPHIARQRRAPKCEHKFRPSPNAANSDQHLNVECCSTSSLKHSCPAQTATTGRLRCSLTWQLLNYAEAPMKQHKCCSTAVLVFRSAAVSYCVNDLVAFQQLPAMPTTAAQSQQPGRCQCCRHY